MNLNHPSPHQPTQWVPDFKATVDTTTNCTNCTCLYTLVVQEGLWAPSPQVVGFVGASGPASVYTSTGKCVATSITSSLVVEMSSVAYTDTTTHINLPLPFCWYAYRFSVTAYSASIMYDIIMHAFNYVGYWLCDHICVGLSYGI